MADTIIVTGGAGFIGSCFVAQAVEQGYHVVVVDSLTYAGHRENLEWIMPSQAGGSWQLEVMSICEGDNIAQLMDEYEPKAVVNFAAESHVDNSISTPSAFIETNIIGSYTMLEAARQYWQALDGESREAFRFVQISTDEVYGSLGETGKFSEGTAMKPNSPYSASKAAGDHLARAWFKTYGLPTIVTNCTNNYGPRQYPEKLIPHMISRALEGKSLPIYGDGKNIRDWVHVEDHSAGVMLAMQKGQAGETYCFGGDAEKNNIELVHSLCAILDELQPRPNGQEYASLIAFVPDRPGHDRRYAIDDSKAQKALGFTRRYSFEEGIRKTVQWYLDNPSWCASVSANKGAVS